MNIVLQIHEIADNLGLIYKVMIYQLLGGTTILVCKTTTLSLRGKQPEFWHPTPVFSPDSSMESMEGVTG